MLSSFEILNYKSYSYAELPLAPLTVLIGANASGKSNAIEGLRLISWLAQGQKLSSIQYSVNSSEQIVRGTVSDLPHEGTEFGFSCQLLGEKWGRWEIWVKLRSDGLHISSESMTSGSGGVPLYVLDQEAVGRGNDVGVAYNNFARGGKKPHITCTDQMPIFVQLTTPAAFSASHKESRRTIPRVTKALEAVLSSILILDPNPKVMRGYSFPVDDRLRGDGSNLSAILYNLCGQPNEEVLVSASSRFLNGHNAAAEVLSLIQSLPEQNIEGIHFIKEPRGGVMVTLSETFGNVKRSFDASLLSDGTLRVLSIGAALLSAPEGSMVVVEEIDNGVHPSRAKHLLASIQRIAKARELRVLMTTHNPALLDALPDDSIPHVLFCYRSPEDGSSQILRLSDKDDFPEIVSQGSLGDLLTEGILDRYAKIKSDAASRKAAALQWLKDIR